MLSNTFAKRLSNKFRSQKIIVRALSIKIQKKNDFHETLLAMRLMKLSKALSREALSFKLSSAAFEALAMRRDESMALTMYTRP